MATTITQRVSGTITANTTQRVTGTPTGNAAPFFGHRIFLEGAAQDNGSVLLLEGAAQVDGTDAEALEGAARNIAANHTTRVTGL